MKPPVWASILTITGVLILCGLGSWQFQRLQWKTDILAQIDTAYAKDPMDFELTGSNLAELEDDTLFVRGFAEGLYLHDKEIAIGPRTSEGTPGYHIITPFETLDNHIILVNRGWVPMDYKSMDIVRPDEPMIITGTARKPERINPFVPKNMPEQDQWFRLEPESIAAAKGLAPVMPYILYVESDDRFPHALDTAWRPNNNHLSYALFWFSMAGILLIIFYLRFIRKAKT